MGFIHLNVKTEYSVLNGITKTNDCIKKAASLGMTHLACTDLNNMFGAYKFEKACLKNEILPIHGVTFTIKDENGYSNLELLAENEQGYKNLVRLSTIANVGIDPKGEKKIPSITAEDLQCYHEGLICLSGGMNGRLFKCWSSSGDCESYLSWIMSIFDAKHFYIEMTNHGHPDEIRFMSDPQIFDLKKRFGLSAIATNDVYYLEKEHAFHRGIAFEMNPNPESIPFTSAHVSYNDEFYFKSEEEMMEVLKDGLILHPEMIEMTESISKRCENVRVPVEKALPEFPIPEGLTNVEYLMILTQKGFDERFPDDDSFFAGMSKEDYKKQLDYELKTIVDMGFVDYFLIVQDYINWCKDPEVYKHPEIYFPSERYDYAAIPENILRKDFEIFVGPGRGSAAGSLLAYCLKITDELDPIKNKLFFERFLNAERVSMPDIDVDFCNAYRSLVVQYVQYKYGYDHVAQIVTFQTLKTKRVLKAVGKVYGLPYELMDDLSKHIPDTIYYDDPDTGERKEKSVTLSELTDLEYFKQKISENEDLEKVLDAGKVLENLPAQTGKHAAGVIIGARPLQEQLPLMEVDGVMVIQFEKVDCESINLLKMDFLGLITLDIMAETFKLIKEVYGVDLSIDTIPWDDPKTYELLQSGHTSNVFQLESPGMKNLLRQLHPQCFEDINAVIALYRPGPMDFIPKYLEGKKDPSSVNYPHPLLQQVTKETYGILCYQEQLMQVVQLLAGFTLGHADILRKYISKKNTDAIQNEKVLFLKGCKEVNNIDEGLAEEIFSYIEPFARYGFNRAHSAAYAVIVYKTAYLKANYPECFMAANCTVFSQDTKKLGSTLAECTRMGIKVLPPDILRSTAAFKIEEQDSKKMIRYSLSAIKGCGQELAESLADKSNIDSFRSAIRAIPLRLLRKDQMTGFVHSGAFDRFGVRRELCNVLPALIEEIKLNSGIKKSGVRSFFDLIPSIDRYEGFEYSAMEKIDAERRVLQIALSGHPLNGYRNLYPNIETAIPDLKLDIEGDDSTLFEHQSHFSNTRVEILGILKDIRQIITKTNTQMAMFTVEDEFMDCSGVMFSKDLEKLTQDIQKFENVPVRILALAKEHNHALSLCVNEITPLNSIQTRLYIQKESIDQNVIRELAKNNGMAKVIFVNTTDATIETAPFSIDLSKKVKEILRSNSVHYNVMK